MNIENLNVFCVDETVYAFYNDTELGVVSVYQTLPGETALTCIGDSMAGWPITLPTVVHDAINVSMNKARADFFARGA